MQNAPGLGCAEPSSPPVPNRGLWSRAVLGPRDPVMPFPAVSQANSLWWDSKGLPLLSDQLLEQHLKTGGESGRSSALYLFIKGCLGTVGLLLTLI